MATTIQNGATPVSLHWLRDQIAFALTEIQEVQSSFPDLKIPLLFTVSALEFGLREFDRAKSPLAQRGALVGSLTTLRASLSDALARHPEYRERSSILCDVEQLALAHFHILET